MYGARDALLSRAGFANDEHCYVPIVGDAQHMVLERPNRRRVAVHLWKRVELGVQLARRSGTRAQRHA